MRMMQLKGGMFGIFLSSMIAAGLLLPVTESVIRGTEKVVADAAGVISARASIIPNASDPADGDGDGDAVIVAIDDASSLESSSSSSVQRKTKSAKAVDSDNVFDHTTSKKKKEASKKNKDASKDMSAQSALTKSAKAVDSNNVFDYTTSASDPADGDGDGDGDAVIIAIDNASSLDSSSSSSSSSAPSALTKSAKAVGSDNVFDHTTSKKKKEASSTSKSKKKTEASKKKNKKASKRKKEASKNTSAPSALTKNQTCPDRNQGGFYFPVPVILNVTTLKFPENEYYKRMIIQGYNYSDPDPACHAGDLEFVAQQGFWYLEVFPLSATNHDCLIPDPDNLFGFYNTSNVPVNDEKDSSCNLYDFRLVIFNNLEEDSTTIHFHGLTPPSNEDGVPFVANAAIHPQNWQKYRFDANKYAGLHWMHAHTGFHQAFGVAVPIVFHHADTYYDANTEFRKEDDVIVMLEEGFIYPQCAYSPYWYHELCQHINRTDYGKMAFLINRQEEPIVVTPAPDAKYIRIRFLNGGSEAPWRIDGTNVTAEGGSMEILATDGNDVERGTFTEKFVLGLANRCDVLVKVTPNRDMLITAIQMKHSGPVKNPALRHIVIRSTTARNGEKIRINDLPTYDKNAPSPILENFNLMVNLTAEHALVKRKITRSFTVINQGGDQYGGFPLTIYDGLPNEDGFLINPDGTGKKSQLPRTGELHNYTQLNHLKFQLPPYKVYRHNITNEFISTRRPCADCVTGDYNRSGIRNRPRKGEDYDVWDSSYTKIDVTNPTCCWEWCDVEPDQCDHYKLEDVKYYEPNKNYIPVCYGDRVRILFINTGSFEISEGHPMHLHGHEFVLSELFNVTASNTSTINILLTRVDTDDLNYEQAEFKRTGPKVDTIWVPYNQALAFDFDAYNPGEHLFHCHNDFHLENGMMTTIRYMDDDYCESSTRTEFKGGTNKYPTQFCSMDDCQPSTLSNNRKEEL